MATPSEKLAESLEVLHKLQNADRAAAIRARDLTRTHRERLLKNGFLKEVMKAGAGHWREYSHLQGR
jgi:hypothetical protein